MIILTKKTRPKGLSMPELMVAMTILFVVSTFIMSMFVTGMRQTSQATQNQRLESLTKLKISELRAMPYASLVGQVGTSNFSAPDQDYEFTVSLSPLQGESANDAQIVEVTVTHPEYGTRNARTVRSNVVVDPGRAAWEKFSCGTCHFLPNAGLPDSGVGVQISLGPINVNDPSNPRPVPPGPNGLETYISDSIVNPDNFMAYTDQGAMQNFYVEGEPSPATGDPGFDPNSTDPFVAGNSMSQQEVQALATWINSMQ